MRSYEAARSLFSFLAFISWSVVVFGVIVALMSAAGVSQYAGGGAGLLAMVPGIGIGIIGFILVAFVQMGRATVDTAEYTQQMLKIARDQLEVSRQGLKPKGLNLDAFGTVKKEEQKPAIQSFSSQPAATMPTRIPEEEPVGTKYKGKMIEECRGVYLCNGNPFQTLNAAKQFIDNMPGTSTKNFPGAY